MADSRDNNNYGWGYGNSGNKPSETTEAIGRLERMRDQFNREAQEKLAQAKSLDKAIEQLLNVENAHQKAVVEQNNVTIAQRAALLSGMMLGTRKKDQFIVMVDGSGSMNGTPITMALDTATMLHKAAGFSKQAAQVGVFGDSNPRWIGDISDAAQRKPVEQGLNTGTDFAPSVQDIERIAALNTIEGKKTRLVILSDGDLFDLQNTKEALEKLLRQNKNVTVDLFVIGRPGTMFERLVNEMGPEFSSRIKHHVVYDANQSRVAESVKLQNKVVEAMAERLQKPAKKPAAPTP